MDSSAEVSVRALIEAIDQEDWHTMRQLLHPQTEYRVHGYPPFIGRDAVLEYYRETRPISQGLHTIEYMICDGDLVLCCGHFDGATRDGGSVSIDFVDRCRFLSGLIVDRRVYISDACAPDHDSWT